MAVMESKVVQWCRASDIGDRNSACGQTFHHYVTLYRFIGYDHESRASLFFLFSWRSPVQVTRRKNESEFRASSFRHSKGPIVDSVRVKTFVFFAFVRGARSQEKKLFFLVEFDWTNFVCFDFHSVPASKSRFKIFRDISIRASEEMKEIHKVNTTPVDVEIKADKKLMITISFKAPTNRESSRPGSTTKGSIKY